jgi:hypothetical protein
VALVNTPCRVALPELPLFTPTKVNGNPIVTASGYVPGHTLMVSPVAEASTAACIVEKLSTLPRQPPTCTVRAREYEFNINKQIKVTALLIHPPLVHVSHRDGYTMVLKGIAKRGFRERYLFEKNWVTGLRSLNLFGENRILVLPHSQVNGQGYNPAVTHVFVLHNIGG